MADEKDGNKGGGRKIQASSATVRGGYTAMPNLVLRNGSLSGNAKTLYALLMDALWREDEPELDELGAQLGGGKKTAQSAIKELVDVGLVTSKRRGQGKTNAYIVHSPDEIQKVSEGASRRSPAADPTTTKDLVEDAEGENKFSPSGEGTTRKRNVVFDALAESTGANPAASAGQIAKAAKAIREAEADAIREACERVLAQNPELDEVPKERIDNYLAAKIRDRAARYREMRPDWELTPTALASHWLRIPTWEPRGAGPAGQMTPSELANLDLG